MTQEQIEDFKNLLLQERQRVINSIQTATGDLKEAAASKEGDEMDIAVNANQTGLMVRMKEREAHYLSRIDEALGRIDDGSYGECEDCGEDITIKRLESRLVATLCIGCKEQEERRERSYGIEN